MYDYVIIDLEMCNINKKWKNNGVVLHKEIIQIGAALVDQNHTIVDTFSTYVRPEHGKIDQIITEITGIRQVMVRNAPLLQEAAGMMCRWIGKRKVIIMSWSNSDYNQFTLEMKAKEIRNRKMSKMMENWCDFQKSFGNMLGIKRQISLYDALEMARIKPAGKAHDGLSDAYNTARLFCRIYRQDRFVLNLIPIRKEGTTSHTYPAAPWTLRRMIYRLFHGKEAASEAAWKRFLFQQEMKKVARYEQKMGIKEKILI